MDAASGRSGRDRRKLRRGGGFLVAALVLGIAPATALAQPSGTPPTLEPPATIVSDAAVEEDVPPPPVVPVPVLEIVSGVPGIEAAALADTLEPRVAGFTLVAETTSAVVPGAYRLEVATAPDGAGLRLLLRNAEGRALVRDVASGGEASADEPLRLVAVLASHMLEELVLLEMPPTPVAPPPVIVPPPPPPPPPPPELPPPPEPPPPPPFELGVFGGIQGNDLGGSPAGAGTGWTVFLRGAYSILPWLGVALESGWSGIASDQVDGLFSIVPLRLGIDFGINIAILRASVGARLTVDVWTAKVDRRETGSRVGGGLFSTVAIFPWENLGFGIAAAMDLFPVAVQLRANDEDVFSLGWLRFLFSAGIVARM